MEKLKITLKHPTLPVGETKSGSSSNRKTLNRTKTFIARKDSIDKVAILTTIDDSETNIDLLFESIDHRINSVENMLSRNKANQESEWKRRIGVFLVSACMSMFYCLALPWFTLIQINFSTYCGYSLSFDYVKNDENVMIWKRRTKYGDKAYIEAIHDQSFDGLNEKEMKAFMMFEVQKKPVEPSPIGKGANNFKELNDTYKELNNTYLAERKKNLSIYRRSILFFDPKSATAALTYVLTLFFISFFFFLHSFCILFFFFFPFPISICILSLLLIINQCNFRPTVSSEKENMKDAKRC